MNYEQSIFYLTQGVWGVWGIFVKCFSEKRNNILLTKHYTLQEIMTLQ
jgi:hypothetical protein